MYATRMPKLGRRHFLKHASTIGAAVLLGGRHHPAVGEPAPETTKIRFVHVPSICVAPQYLAEELLRLDGFTDIEYLPLGSRNGLNAIGEGRADIAMWDIPALMPHLDANKPILVLAGVHAGCYELFVNESVRSIRDLKSKTVAIQYLGGGDQIMLSSMLAYVGMNPDEVKWIVGQNNRDAINLFIDGKADAILGFAQQPAELRAKKIGHGIVNTGVDRPWSQYFCCMIAANRDFVQRNPVATKRVVRAILKSADICAAEPQRAARYLADKLYEPRFDIGLEVMKNVQYDRWRTANPEDTIRFHALRLHEVGMIKTKPNELIARATDWRFLNQLKKELKA
jgi:NitT/TauT family transport system substrate-binding protein